MTPDGQSFSTGIAQWDGAETAEQLVARADAALYRAKSAGRNRVRHRLARQGDGPYPDVIGRRQDPG